jgi:hypothetical protein
VFEHDPKFRISLGNLRNQEWILKIENEIAGFDFGEAAAYASPNAAKLGMALVFVQQAADLGVVQVHPSDHPPDEIVAGGELEVIRRVLPGADHHRSVEPIALQYGKQELGRILRGEVLVSIQAQGWVL